MTKLLLFVIPHRTKLSGMTRRPKKSSAGYNNWLSGREMVDNVLFIVFQWNSFVNGIQFLFLKMYHYLNFHLNL